MKPDLIKHLSGEPIGRFPAWAMRQAGRYLPNYRAIRAEHTFWEMVANPNLAADVSLTPIGTLPVDAVIFFSDILTLPYGMNIPVEMREGVGPVCTAPLRSAESFSVFESYSPQTHTPFVSEALQLVRKRMSPDLALLGFAGAPWTVASYLSEGTGGRKFEAIRTWMHRDPSDLARALSLLGDATVSYLGSQAEAGAHAVQLFDTWLAEMPRDFFLQHYRPILEKMFAGLRAFKVPLIFYSRHAHHVLADLAGLDFDVLSADELLPLTEVEKRTGGQHSLQGNLDPMLLFGEASVVRRSTRELVAEARKLSKPAILNLGHGILPKTPVENVRAFFEEARTLWV